MNEADPLSRSRVRLRLRGQWEIDEQVMLQAYDHLETTHGVEEVDPALGAKVEAAIVEA